jgi:hypothetical protein
MHSQLIKIAEEFNVTVYMTNQGNFAPSVAVFFISLNLLELQIRVVICPQWKFLNIEKTQDGFNEGNIGKYLCVEFPNPCL